MAENEIKNMLIARRPEIEAALTGYRYLSAERLITIGVHAAERGAKALRESDPASIVRCIIQCGEMGLEPNTPLGHAYLVPFWADKVKKYFCQVIVGYKGFKHLAMLSGAVDDFHTDIVCEDEVKDFIYDPFNLKQPIIHKPRLFGGIREHIAGVRPDRDGVVKGVVGAYSVAYLSNGIVKAQWASLDEILKARSRSEAVKSEKGPSGPWVDWPLSMYQKTPVRRQCGGGEIRRTGEIAPRMAAALGAEIETTDYTFTDLSPEPEPDDLPKGTRKGKTSSAASADAGAGKSGASPPNNAAGLPAPADPKRTAERFRETPKPEPEPEPEAKADEPIGIDSGAEYFEQAQSIGLKPGQIHDVLQSNFSIHDTSELRASQTDAFLRACAEKVKAA